jgi:tetratricopeptide (TPR) repeat protein/DNA-binding SARP family transcriptional activator
MEFIILGPTALHVNGQPVPLGAAKQRGMLAVLLFHAGVPVRIDTIVEQLWDSPGPGDPRVHLYALASRIRAVLNRVGLPDSLVRVHSIGAYRLDVPPNLVDYHRFRRLVAEAREAGKHRHHDTSVALLTKAVGMWRDEPLADLRGWRSEHMRQRMKDALLDAHRLLADSQLQLGQHQAVLARLEPLMHTYDMDEALARSWIAALCAAGRDDEARTFFVAFRRRFRMEMQAEPVIELPRAADRHRSARAGPAARRPPGRGPRGVSKGPWQLPNDINDFTGHEELLAELDLLTSPDNAGTKVVVVDGMPGAGKTTLAVHWAHQRRYRFPDGQLYLNASAYGPVPPVQPDEALSRFLRALDVPVDRIPITAEQRWERLNRLLAGRRMVIVLDNVRDSNQARPLIPTSAGCVTLITSRNRLTGLTVRDGVRCVTVSALPDHESLTLLRQIVGAARADAEPEALEALVRLSGGLPLALRIIGEHVAERPRATIADLVHELTAHLLDSDGEDDENANLRTVFAWSYNALRPDAARLFRILGMHPGSSASTEAAAAMLGTDPSHAEHVLNTLAKAHLVNHDTARRYRFHDLLRLYASQRAHREETVEERDNAMRRLLDWYVLTAANAFAVLAPQCPPVPDLPEPDGVEPLAFDGDAEAMKWCEAERGNLVAVARWAARNGFYRHGWQIPGAVYEIFERYGRPDDILELNELGVASAEKDGHPEGRIGLWNNLGTTYLALHNYPGAAASFEAGLRLAREIGHVEGERANTHNLAWVHLKVGEVSTAVELYSRALDMCRTASNPPAEAAILHRLGDAHRSMKRYDEAVRYYLASLAISERIGSPRGQAATHGELAVLYLEIGQLESAIDHCRPALDINGRTKDEPARADTLITMGDIERELGSYKEAARHAQQAVAISEEIGDSLRRCRALTVLAHTYAGSGNANGAQRTCTYALNIAHELTDPDAGPLRERLRAIEAGLAPPAAAG